VSKLRVFADTNVLVDFLSRREPFYRSARLLMLCAKVGEFELFASSSQFTDLVYVLSDGGRRELLPAVLERLRELRTFVEVFVAGPAEVDRMLSAGWKDPEDSLVFECALSCKADVIATRDAGSFESSAIPALSCEELFSWMAEERGIDYVELDKSAFSD
jgi:predicted nucleic acid-binding protein